MIENHRELNPKSPNEILALLPLRRGFLESQPKRARAYPLETPQYEAFFSFQAVDAAGNSLSNEQTIYDKDQTIASRLDEIVTIQSHVSNQRAKVGARMNSAQRLRDILEERQILINQDVSDLQDADLATLVTSLQSQLTSQEASQKAFINISKLNLFDFIG